MNSPNDDLLYAKYRKNGKIIFKETDADEEIRNIIYILYFYV